MADCKHDQCSICLGRECQKYVNGVKEYGDLMACNSCVAKSVAWAYKTAALWGGEYRDGEPCGGFKP